MLQKQSSVAFAPISDDFDASSSANATQRKTGLLKSARGMGVQNQGRSHARERGDWHLLDKKNKKIIKKKRREPLYLLTFCLIQNPPFFYHSAIGGLPYSSKSIFKAFTNNSHVDNSFSAPITFSSLYTFSRITGGLTAASGGTGTCLIKKNKKIKK